MRLLAEIVESIAVGILVLFTARERIEAIRHLEVVAQSIAVGIRAVRIRAVDLDLDGIGEAVAVGVHGVRVGAVEGHLVAVGQAVVVGIAVVRVGRVDAHLGAVAEPIVVAVEVEGVRAGVRVPRDVAVEVGHEQVAVSVAVQVRGIERFEDPALRDGLAGREVGAGLAKPVLVPGDLAAPFERNRHVGVAVAVEIGRGERFGPFGEVGDDLLRPEIGGGLVQAILVPGDLLVVARGA